MNDYGFLFAYSLDGSGSGQELTLEEIDHYMNNNSPCWLHFDYSHPNFIDWLKQKTGFFDEWLIESLTEEGIRARTITRNEYLYTCLRSINLIQEQEEEDMVSVRVFLTSNLIITTRSRELRIVKRICSDIDQAEGPKTPVEVLSYLLDEINNELSRYIAELVDEVDSAEQSILHNFEPKENLSLISSELSNIKRRVLVLKRHLSPQKDALNALYTTQSLLLNGYRQTFQDSLNSTLRNFEELELARERCGLIQEQLKNIVAEQMNRRMYLFSLLTAVFLPLSSIGSLFGMNLGGIPGSSNSFAFALVCSLLGITSCGLLIYLKKAHWF